MRTDLGRQFRNAEDDSVFDKEWVELTTEEAAELAKPLREQLEVPETRDIPPSLLSAEHIIDCVMATGMISPFHLGGKKRRLKKASYEGRVGARAYEFFDSRLVSIHLSKGYLRVPANSIVFVEPDLDFRLPNFIAVRFNLHINHVHRGLLLGTGPLVDPGFWGKLCIPLHNLTSEDYDIPLTEGLFWFEFTKTTSPSKLGSRPNNDGFWNIDEFIKKAARGIVGVQNAPIQSSIPLVVRKATDTANEAKATAERTRNFVATIGLLAIFGALFGVITFLSSFVQGTYGVMSSAKQELSAKIESQGSELDELRSQVDALSRRIGQQDSTR